MSNLSVTIDWKFVVALGASAVGIIFAVKMDDYAAEECQPKWLMLARSLQLLNSAIVNFVDKGV